MSKENVKLALRFAEAINAREIPDDLLAPDFRLENVKKAVTEGVYLGKAGVEKWISDFFDVMDERARFEIEKFIEVGDDYVVVRARLVGLGVTSSAPVELRWVTALWIRDGKFSRGVGFLNRREALEAVGQSEQAHAGSCPSGSAMSRENIEILRQANAAFNRGDIEGFLAFVVDDIEVEDLKNAPDFPPVVHGKGEVRKLLAAWTETFRDFKGEIEEYIDIDDHHVACVVHYRGKERRTGMDVEFKTVDMWEIRDRKLVLGKLSYPDREAALEAVRLSEQDAHSSL